MTDKRVALLAELKTVILEVSRLTDRDGVSVGQREQVLTVLREYVASLESSPSSIIDCNRVARIVVEYWPMNLPVGEHIVSIEQKLRAFYEQGR